jgi:YbbR domain-containing protein
MTSTWFGIARGFNTLVSYEVPIEFLNNDPDLEVVETSSNTERLHLSGSSFLIKSLSPGQIRVRTHVDKAGSGKHEIPITLKDVTLPPGIMLNRIDPPQVAVVLAKPTMNMVPVQVDWVGKLPDDLVLTGITLTPALVTVTGKSHEVKKLSTVYTEKISLNNIRYSGNRRVALVLDQPSLKLPDDQRSVVVEYVVEKRSPETS